MDLESEYDTIVTIPLWDYTKGDLQIINHEFPADADLTMGLLRNKFNLNLMKLTFVPTNSDQETDFVDGLNPVNVAKFIKRNLEQQHQDLKKQPTDSSLLTWDDLKNEGVAHLTVKLDESTPRMEHPEVQTIIDLLRTPVVLPTTREFKVLIEREGCSFKEIPEQTDEFDAYIGTNKTAYYKYWVIAEKIRQTLLDDFLGNDARSEAQWRSNIYEPLFSAASTNSLVTTLNPFALHETILNNAIATSKMRSFASGPNALKPDIADGWLKKNKNSTADAFCGNYAFNLDQPPFSSFASELGDRSHLLLDCIAELKRSEGKLEETFVKVYAELAITSSVMQFVTARNDLLNFGFAIAKESVYFFVMHPLQRLPLKYKPEDNQLKDSENDSDDYTKDAESSKGMKSKDQVVHSARLQGIQLFGWNLQSQYEYYHFAIFLWRLRTFRVRQFRKFLPTLRDKQKEISPQANDNSNQQVNKDTNPAMNKKPAVLNCLSTGQAPNDARIGSMEFIYEHSNARVKLMTLPPNQKIIVKQFYNSSYDLLVHECKIYKLLEGLKYIPDVIPVSEVYSLGLEYVEGKHYFEAKTLTNVLNYMIQLLKALHDIHARGVIHSDIKFDNVIYNSVNSTLKVIDFGYSVIAEDENSLVPCTGYTEKYAAPEVRTSSHVGYVSDIFSAGLMFTSLLYGTELTSNNDYRLFQQLTRRVPNRFSCPKASAIAAKMIAGDWMQRISASAALEKLQCILLGLYAREN